MKYIIIILILLVVYIGYCDYNCNKENFVDGGDSGIYNGSLSPNSGIIHKSDAPLVDLNKINSAEQFNVNDSDKTTSLTVTDSTSNTGSSSEKNMQIGKVSNINKPLNTNETSTQNKTVSSNESTVQNNNVPDLSNYILKSEAQNACPDKPDMSKYILKTNIPQCKEKICPDLSKYTLKTSINVKDCPRVKDLSKYILKTEIPIVTDSEKALKNYLSLKNNINTPPTEPPVQPPTEPPVQPPTEPPSQPSAQPLTQPPTQPPAQPNGLSLDDIKQVKVNGSNNKLKQLVNNASQNISKFMLNEVGKRVDINKSIGEILISFFDKNNDKSLTKNELNYSKDDINKQSDELEKKLGQLQDNLCDKACHINSSEHEAYITNLFIKNPELTKLKSKKDIMLGDIAMAIFDKDYDNNITELEINELIQKSVEISILMGIKELCNTCKNKNREQVNNTSLTNNKDLSNQDLSTEDITDNDTEQTNNAPLHLLTVPSEASRSTTEKSALTNQESIPINNSSETKESFANYTPQYSDINHVSNQYQHVSYPKCNHKLPPSNARPQHYAINRCNNLKKNKYHNVVYGPY
mgnify:CR=1 FL=1